jgi:ATP-dependent DNA ligase
VPPSGPGWIHEIKHDGFRIMARRIAAKIAKLPQLYTNKMLQIKNGPSGF